MRLASRERDGSCARTSRRSLVSSCRSRSLMWPGYPGMCDAMPSAALLVVDMLNPYDHDDADALADHAAAIVEPLADLVRRAREADVDVIYVNDNMGDFTATRHDLVRRALDGRRPELVEPLVPPDDLPFLQKVRH